MIRVVLPYHLRTIARIADDAAVDVHGPITIRAVLDALEAKHPALRGTIRDHDTKLRRPFIRFFACNRDFSNEPPDTPLPPEISAGIEPLLIIGAIAGG